MTLQSPTAVSETVGGLSGFGNDEVYEPRRQVKRNMSFEMKRAMENLDYTEADLELLTADSRQFNVLKQSLRNKGAVTNEVLKQKLPLYIKYKKDRLAKTHPEVAEALKQMPTRTRSMGRLERIERMSAVKPVNRLLSDKETRDAEEPQSMLGRIMRPGAKKSTPQRSRSNATKQRSTSRSRGSAPRRGRGL